jgi:RHS repeat-associated protein
VSSVTTNYTWDRIGLGVVLDDGEEYVWGLGLIAQITGGGTDTYAHQDGLGSIRVLTDDTGASVGTQTYDAFGATRSQSGTQLGFTYTGEQIDAESGLVYLRARYMDPAQGRFQTRDLLPGSANLPLSQHRYSYTFNSPLRYIDPSGLWPDGVEIPGIDDVVSGAVSDVVDVVGDFVGSDDSDYPGFLDVATFVVEALGVGTAVGALWVIIGAGVGEPMFGVLVAIGSILGWTAVVLHCIASTTVNCIQEIAEEGISMTLQDVPAVFWDIYTFCEEYMP